MTTSEVVRYRPELFLICCGRKSTTFDTQMLVFRTRELQVREFRLIWPFLMNNQKFFGKFSEADDLPNVRVDHNRFTTVLVNASKFRVVLYSFRISGQVWLLSDTFCPWENVSCGIKLTNVPLSYNWNSNNLGPIHRFIQWKNNIRTCPETGQLSVHFLTLL